MKLRWVIVFAWFLVISCGGNQLPEGILTKDKMVPMLVDQHLAETIFAQRITFGLKSENTLNDLYLSILKKYGVDRKVFEESVFYYSKHPKQYKEIYDEVLNRLNAMEVKVKQEDPSLKR
jgi:hypothetical protein